MTRARFNGGYALFLGCMLFVICGGVLESDYSVLADFTTLYFPTRSLLQHHDPYMQSEVLKVYHDERGNSPAVSADNVQIATRDVYPPTMHVLIAPIAALPLAVARLVWLTLSSICIIAAVIATWSCAADDAPLLSGLLLGLLAANSELILVSGNSAGVVIGLCAIAVWCFQRQQFTGLGVVCMAVSLALKPHDTGLVWMYFLLAGGIFRKRALEALAAVMAIGIPALLWVWSLSPHWLRELEENLGTFSVHGAINDPGMVHRYGAGMDVVVGLQTIVSAVRDDPRFYNPVSYLICAPVIVVWMWITLRARPSNRNAWLALAAIAPITMLPVYHRIVDTKLIMLAVPACAMLWARGGWTGRVAALLTTAGIILTGDNVWLIAVLIFRRAHLTGALREVALVAQSGVLSLVLLSMTLFYLWAYARAARTLQVAPNPDFLAGGQPRLPRFALFAKNGVHNSIPPSG